MESLGVPKWAYTKGLHDLGGGGYAYLQPDGYWGRSNAGLVVDFGDAPVIPADPERSHAAIERLVRQVAEAGAIPVVLGGDHSIAEPDIRAVASVHGPVGLDIGSDSPATIALAIVSEIQAALHATPQRKLHTSRDA